MPNQLTLKLTCPFSKCAVKPLKKTWNPTFKGQAKVFIKVICGVMFILKTFTKVLLHHSEGLINLPECSEATKTTTNWLVPTQIFIIFPYK